MTQFWNRSFSLQIGDRLIESRTVDGKAVVPFKIKFKVDRDLGKQANTAEIDIHNLNAESRGAFAGAKFGEDPDPLPRTILQAGYSGRRSVIFQGLLEHATSIRDGTDWVTSFETSDSGKALAESRINESFAKISFEGAIRACAEKLGVGLGNAIEKAKQGNTRGALQSFTNGLVLSGPTKKELDLLVRSAGYTWSIQNGELQFIAENETITPGQVVRLTPNSGLIATPTTGETGITTIVSLIQPGLEPGRALVLESELISGDYRIERTVYSGDTWGQDWYATIEAKPL